VRLSLNSDASTLTTRRQRQRNVDKNSLC